MRCLTLAYKLQKNADVIFLCREHPGNLCRYIRSAGFKLYGFPLPARNKSLDLKTDRAEALRHALWLGGTWDEDAEETIKILINLKADCLIVDHFGIDASWERRVREATSIKIAVIDGQKDRPHDCDFLLDPNFSIDPEASWKSLIPPNCQLFAGPQFAILRQEFIEEKKNLQKRDGQVKRILIAFGGVDGKNATGMTLEALKKINLDIPVDVVAGLGNPHWSELQKICRSIPKARIHLQTSRIATLMAAADLAIGAGGTMTWERCYLGLPAIIVSIAKNQDRTCQALAQKNAAVYLGKQEEAGIRSIADAIHFAIENQEFMRKMSRNAMQIMETANTSGIEIFCKAILHETHN